MDKRIEPFLTHAHTDASNFRLRDAINKVEDLLDYCLELNLEGVVITDHEVLSSHVKAHKYISKNKDKFKDFKLGFGNEIYLVDREEVEEKREVQDRIQFYHFILIAKNQNGYEGLKKLSSKAWSGSFFYKGMERVPTYKDDLIEIMREYKGDIIATSACVGGEVPQLLIEFYRNPTEENRKKANDLIIFMKELFGEDFYLELQPSKNEDQLIANKMLEKIGKEYNIKNIVSTDAHYLNPEQAKAHEIYLTASQGDREVKEFYATTYVMDYQELNEYFDEELLNEMVLNTHEIKDKLEPISFKQETKIPRAHIPEFELNKLFEPFYDKYEYIKKYSESNYEVDRFYLHLIAEGMIEKEEELNEENLSRINLELNEIYYITKEMNQPLSSYFVLTKELIDIMWKVSLVGVSRGSASCYYTNYLLNIVQINPIKYNLPHWRFLSKERPELPDELTSL